LGPAEVPPPPHPPPAAVRCVGRRPAPGASLGEASAGGTLVTAPWVVGQCADRHGRCGVSIAATRAKPGARGGGGRMACTAPRRVVEWGRRTSGGYCWQRHRRPPRPRRTRSAILLLPHRSRVPRESYGGRTRKTVTRVERNTLSCWQGGWYRRVPRLGRCRHLVIYSFAFLAALFSL